MYKLTQRKGRCVQCMFDSSGKWISTGCHDRKSAMEWAEARDDRLLFRNFAKDFHPRGRGLSAVVERQEAQGVLTGLLLVTSEHTGPASATDRSRRGFIPYIIHNPENPNLNQRPLILY